MDKHADFLGSNPADPYEEQLLEMFRSCDSWNHGYLDRCGLELLCTKLHLEEARPQLIECLLNSKQTVTFVEFRDALLTLLGSAMKQSEENRDPSPVREVSPKFVFGQKKYGRRSRPESTDQDGGVHDIHIDESDADAFVPSIDEKGAEKEVHDEAAHPQNNDIIIFDKNVLAECEEEEQQQQQQSDSPRSQCELELKAAWQRLGVGSDGCLDQAQLASVCRAIGMERAANEIVREVFSKVGCDADGGRISFDEFVQLLRSGYTCPPSPLQTSPSPPPTPTPFHPTIHPTSLDVSSSGYVSADSVVELWEMSGVPDAASLLQELGVSSSQDVSLSLLSGILDEELRTLRTSSVKLPSSPLVTYLSASLTLSHVQLKQSKNSLEQLTGERDKLRNDLAEANHRATLLAQEVDDSHARLERATQKQVKLLEQRHTEQVKQLTSQLVTEREQLTGTTLRLEKKLADVQEEESRLRSEVSSLQSECLNMEKENRNLIEQLALSETTRKHAQDEIQRMESLQIRLSELEGSSFQVASLVEQLTALQSENTKLRDRNDELTTQIETLSTRLSNRKQGSSMSLEGGSGGGSGGGGGGTKRRGQGHSPVRSWVDVRGDWGDTSSPSPRQGKVRRCCTENDLSLDNVPMEGLAIRPLRHSESGLGADLETLDDSLTLSNCSDNTMSFKVGSDSSKDIEVEKLQAYICELERLVEQYRLKLAVFELGPEMCDEDSEIESNFKTFIKLPHLEEQSTAPRTFIVSKDGDELDLSTHLVDKEISCNIEVSSPKQLTEMEIQTSIQDSHEVDQLEKHCQELESKLNEVQVKILDILNEKKASDEENLKLREEMGLLRKKIDQSKSPTNFNDGIQWDCSLKIEPVAKSEGTLESDVNSDIAIDSQNSQNNRLDSFSFVKEEITISSNDEQQKVFSFDNLCEYSFKVTPDLGCDNDVSFSKSIEKPFTSSPLCLDTCSSSRVNSELDTENKMNYDDSKIEMIECKSCPDDKTVSEENVNNLLLKNKQLSDRCVELETSLDLMRIEYEKCEDYWQSKLDEERRIFDQEQKLSDSKFAELESKILEYAELYGSENDHKPIDNRLPTIEEKYSLERQFIDLEEEFEEFRKRAEAELSARDREIALLKVSSPSRVDSTGCEIGIQTDTVSVGTEKSESISQNKSKLAAGEVRAECSCNCHRELPREVQKMREAKVKLQSEYKVLSHRKEQLLRSISALQHSYPPAVCEREMMQNVVAQLHYQEMRCRHLQSALKHQQRQTEKILQASWEQHKNDLVSVQATLRMTQEKLHQQTKATKEQMERLAKSDVLVKDLFVENGQLLVTIQNLEEHCRYLTDKAMLTSAV
ncbi:blastoderm-specific protein 25D [Nilaparvata lugens]|uniref:blastoderm-specific protein 25D n=1 Tax=Nilaparvata lugens TaxID=108931 RepID=UPI00193D7EB0|nr:blastoderm-specific protein 25D [Nilaparvata lugens]XP_039284025.1 blastoderm-specific protein 25D [Nilaparvata lugens]